MFRKSIIHFLFIHKTQNTMNPTSMLDQMSQLRLAGMQKAYRNLMESRQIPHLSPEELLGLLIQAEWEDRQDRKLTRYLKAAHFRYPASIEETDYQTSRNLDKNQFLQLIQGNFIQKGENLLITGPTGVGKSYLASALGHQVCMLGYRTLYFNTQKLFPKLKLSRADGSYQKEIKRIEKQDLLILDDFGLQHFDQNARMMLLELMEDRHARKSTMIVSQLPVASWYEIIGDSTVADAILDRLVHTAHRIELKGKSMRTKNLNTN